MSNIRVAISSPIDSNLYSLLVTHLCANEDGITVCGVVVLKVFSLKRVRSEFKRLGRNLFIKIINKFRFYNKRESLEMQSLIAKVGLKNNSMHDISEKYKIPFLKVNNPNDSDAVDFLRDKNPDLILSIGSTILKKPFLEIPSFGTLNVHMGILPEYRGIGVTEWPIIENRVDDIGLGITLHFLDIGVDTGPIVKKKKINLNNCDSIDNIDGVYLEEMVNLMFDGVKMVRNGDCFSDPQDTAENEGRQYFSTHPRMKLLAEEKFNHLHD